MRRPMTTSNMTRTDTTPGRADYRKRAEECVELAQAARTPQQRTMLLHIAETWLRLADEATRDVSAKPVATLN